MVKLQSLRRNFGILFVRSNETVQDFVSRIIKIVSQMTSYREKLYNQTLFQKVLRSSTSKFDYVVSMFKESNDLSIFSFYELFSSLQA